MILLSSLGRGHWRDVHPYQHDVYSVSVSQMVHREHVGPHPSIKPPSVIADLLQRVSNPDDRIFDPFLGSGTAIIAAEQFGRACCGMEIEPRYCAVSIARWEAETGQSAVLDA